jgi:hypothetical protein
MIKLGLIFPTILPFSDPPFKKPSFNFFLLRGLKRVGRRSFQRSIRAAASDDVAHRQEWAKRAGLGFKI